jgi:cytidine deaminase
MKTQTIETQIKVLQFDELSQEYQYLVHQAQNALNASYSPYSEFKVGAAVLLDNGKTFAGSNQENAAYPSGLCAERVTLFYANAQYPDVPVTAIAIAAYTDGDLLDLPITPCGACRQVLLEAELRFDKPMDIILYGKKEIIMLKGAKKLLPLCFGRDNLSGKKHTNSF